MPYRDQFNFDDLFDLTEDLICIISNDGYFRRVNPKVCQTLGYSAEELYALPVDSFIHPDDLPYTEEGRRHLRSNKPLIEFENRYVSRQGETIWLSWTSIPVLNTGVIFAIGRNVTARKKIEEQRNQHLNELSKINSELKRMIYTTSHDLRSPVGGLVFALKMLDESKVGMEDVADMLALVKTSVNTLYSKLNSYVDTIIENNLNNKEIHVVNLQQCLDNVLGTLKMTIDGSDAEILADFSAFSAIKFNTAYLESVFLNLISNSIKYRKPGSRPNIIISTRIVNGCPELLVRDNGLGIDMEKHGKYVFGFNKTFHHNPDAKGVGLYLVQSQLQKLGASIRLESKLNDGCCFIISFPVEAAV